MGNSMGLFVSRVWGLVSVAESDYPPEDEAKPGSRSGVTIFRAVNHVNHGQGESGRMPFSEYTTILRLSDSDPQHFTLSFSCYRDLDVGDASMAFSEQQFLGIVKTQRQSRAQSGGGTGLNSTVSLFPHGQQGSWVLASTHQMVSDSATTEESFDKNVTPSTKSFVLQHVLDAQVPTVLVTEEVKDLDGIQLLQSNLYPTRLFHTYIAED